VDLLLTLVFQLVISYINQYQYSSYDRARPSYPQKAVEQMAKTCHITPQSRILDVAAGTGKFTTMLGIYHWTDSNL
jgi:ubiquinone/menaquinone biosynthesis C-methylase UbiE